MGNERENADDPKGRFAYQGLQRIIHEKARLSIMSSLAANPQGLIFTELRALCSLSDGNLSRQIQFLQSAGLVEVWKRFHNNRPQTLCRLTENGRGRFLEYIGELEKVVARAQQSSRKPGAAHAARRPPAARAVAS
ncbi:MAG TPA: transcriptional regulator [Tepidisphaeraceae bacterium]|nr:transcriptional regulator [Tepidisphaeraceae bacterium]